MNTHRPRPATSCAPVRTPARTVLTGAATVTLSLGLVAGLAGCTDSSTVSASYGADAPAVTTGTAPATTTSSAPAPAGTCVGPLDLTDPSDADAVRHAAASTLAVGVTGFDDAAAAVDAGVRHLFIGSSTDRSILNGQGDPDRSLAALTERAGGDLTVSVDEEGGQVQRLADLTGALPSAREMVATMTPAEVTALFTDHAHKMRDLGITMDFAPDTDLDGGADVSDNAIGDRAFSADPDVVVEYGHAVIDGLLAGGITPVIKHFPGHGHATGDSHTGTVSTPPLDDLGADLQPFVVLGRIPGVAVMVGHMQVPGLDDGDVHGADTPASLNPASYRLLRDGVGGTPGTDAVLYTDDLTGMRAVTDRWPAGDAVVTALRAGADAPLVSSGMDAAALPGVLDAVVAAVGDGSLPVDRLAGAADRICGAPAPVPAPAAPDVAPEGEPGPAPADPPAPDAPAPADPPPAPEAAPDTAPEAASLGNPQG